jgi:hypothetical protein
MIPIKIQCGCGQKYAFEVEPVSGRMPGAVACPRCGVDGTTAANSVLSQHFAAQPAMATAAPARVSMAAAAVPQMQMAGGGGGGGGASVAAPSMARVAPAAAAASSVRVSSVATAAPATHTPAPSERKRLPGQLEPERAAAEARSKVMWGDDPEQIVKYLMSQGFSADEARTTIAPMLAERTQAVRKAGVGKMLVGSGMILVGIFSIIAFLMGYLPDKIMGAGVCIGVWGLWKLISGLIMFLSPKSEKGDVGDM